MMEQVYKKTWCWRLPSRIRILHTYPHLSAERFRADDVVPAIFNTLPRPRHSMPI